MRSLEEVRTEIDLVDRQLIELLSRRAGLAQEIGRIKGLDGRPFFTPERERQIFEKLSQVEAAPLGTNHLVAIFREIISAARAAEKPLTVAYWGPPGTFTHQAAVQTFGRSALFQPTDTIEETFLAVERGQADYGVAPIENSTAGVVPETLDLFPQTNVKICAETFLDIHHHLGSHASDFSQIRHVYAGPQPSSQCRRWLREHVPQAEIIDVVPTSRAVQRAVDDPVGAAIANRLCLEIYGLELLAEHIEDHSKNRTRFVVLGHNEPAPSGSDKTSLMFNLRNKPGELYRVLGSFVENEVNLLMIESRPAQRASFEYIFYLDCVGHQSSPNVAKTLQAVRELAMESVILGSYPSYDPNLTGH